MNLSNEFIKIVDTISKKLDTKKINEAEKERKRISAAMHDIQVLKKQLKEALSKSPNGQWTGVGSSWPTRPAASMKKRKYRVLKGAPMWIPRPNISDSSLELIDEVSTREITASRNLTYSDNDVCLCPFEGAAFKVLEGSPFETDHQHWGFKLPKNDESILFVLVHTAYVQVVETDISL